MTSYITQRGLAAHRGPDPRSALPGPPHPHWPHSLAGDLGEFWGLDPAESWEPPASCSFPSTWEAGTHRWLDQSQARGPGKAPLAAAKAGRHG